MNKIKYFEIVRTQTAKPMGRNGEKFTTFNHQIKEFRTLQEAKKWLKGEYYYCKTTYPMFIDDQKGSTKIGKIYAFKNDEYDGDGNLNKFYQQDWVELREVKAQYKYIV